VRFTNRAIDDDEILLNTFTVAGASGALAVQHGLEILGGLHVPRSTMRASAGSAPPAQTLCP